MASLTRFPAPCVVHPTSTHTNTAILLHGRGSNGEEFSQELFESQGSGGLNLREQFPTWKWVFPSSLARFSTIFQEDLSEWFDVRSLSDPSQEESTQVHGLRQSIDFIESLLEEEARLVPETRLVLGGISQGYATSLHVLLAGTRALGAYVGLCGWLPFQMQMEEIATRIQDGQEGRGALHSRLAEFQLSVLGRESQEFAGVKLAAANSASFLRTPVFLGHAQDDDVVDISLGRAVVAPLRKLGLTVTWKEYADCGHWVNEPEGVDDIVVFLTEHGK